jgi:hypothetical protein
VQYSRGGDVDGAELDRAGEERNLLFGQSETFERDREGF